MAKTSYRSCWWLIQAVEGEYGPGSYKKGEGYDINELSKFYKKRFGGSLNRQNFMSWRRIVFKQFGIEIPMIPDPGVIAGKGYGGYFYFLGNPERLEDGGKTLREHIEFLALNEKDEEDVSLDPINDKYKWLIPTLHPTTSSISGSTMGFLSTGSGMDSPSSTGITPRIILGEDKLDDILFAMHFGEVLTIKFGKVRDGVDIDAPYSFEPYQVKEIEGRWYAIGNLYPMGNKESAELAVYDLARLELAYDEENPDVLYEPIKDFDVYYYINRMLDVDGHHPVITGPVISVDIKLNPRVSGYIKKYPLCSAQVRQGRNQFKLYIRFTHDLITQMGAYGDELSLKVVPIEDSIDDEYYGVIQDSLELFRNADENKLFD